MTPAQLGIRFIAVAFWFFVIFTFVASSNFWHRKERKSINVCAWSGMFDLQWIARFEKETGIHVNISYYESNEELLVKLQTTKEHGYDLIMPSDYAVRILIRNQMLKELDKSKLAFYSHLNPILMGHYFDSNNEYTVPFEWSVYGLGINKLCYPQGIEDPTWGLIFKKKLIDARKTMMTNDPLIAIPIAAFYLFGAWTIFRKREYKLSNDCSKSSIL